MKLKFDAEDWLHIIMAVRVAQKVLVDGQHATNAWDPQRGEGILQELLALIKRDKGDPRVVTKIDLTHLKGTLAEDAEPLVATSSVAPEPPAAPVVRGDAPASGPCEDAANVAARLDDHIALVADRFDANADQGIKIFEFLAKLEDRVIAVERRRK